jgi:hypothetical protein
MGANKRNIRLGVNTWKDWLDGSIVFPGINENRTWVQLVQSFEDSTSDGRVARLQI